MLALAAELPATAQQVIDETSLSAGKNLRWTLVEACAGHTPVVALPPFVAQFAVRVASIVELLQLAAVQPADPALLELAATEAAALGPTVEQTVAATAADLAHEEQLFGLACVLGGQVAGRSAPDLDVLDRFGRELGVAFQLVADAQHATADESFQRALAQLDELSEQQARERIVVAIQEEWPKLR